MEKVKQCHCSESPINQDSGDMNILEMIFMKVDTVNPFKSTLVPGKMETCPFCGSLSWRHT